MSSRRELLYVQTNLRKRPPKHSHRDGMELLRWVYGTVAPSTGLEKAA